METKQRNASTASTSFHNNHNVDEFVWKTLTESIDCGWLGDIEEEGFRKEIMDANSSSSDDDDDDAAVVLRLPNVPILNLTCTTDESFSEDEATPAKVAGNLNTDDCPFPADEGEEVALSKAASAIIEEAIAKAATTQQVSFPTVTTTTTTNTSEIKRQQRQSKVEDRDATNKKTKMVPTQPGSSSSCNIHGKNFSRNRQDPPPTTKQQPETQTLHAKEEVKEDGSLAVTDSIVDTVLQESKPNLHVDSQPKNDDRDTTLVSPTTSSYNHLDYGDILVQQADNNSSNQVCCQNGLTSKLSNHIINTNDQGVNVTVTISDTKSESDNDKVPDGYPSDEEHGFKRAHHHCPSNEIVRQKGQMKSKQKYMILAATALLLLLVGGGIVVTVLCATGKCTSAKGDSSKSDSTLTTGKDDNKTVKIPTKFSAFQTTQELYDAVDQYSVVMASLDENVWAHPVSQTYGYPIGNWDVSKLTNFSRVFDPQRSGDFWDRIELRNSTATVETLTEDLSKWDVSNAKTMYGMFAYSNWKVTGLSEWDISRVEDLRYIFYHARYFTDDLCTWGRSISQQTQVSNMFVHSACTNTSDPAYLIFGPMGLSGPWCENCPGQFGMSTR